MRKIFITLIILFSIHSPLFASVVQGGVQKDGIIGKNRVFDSATGEPIGGAKISLPQEGYNTYTDSNGNFVLNTYIDGQTVLSVEKPGYKPYSVTVDKSDTSKTMALGIEKSAPKDITIATEMFHLGDNSYSELSANSGEFQVQSIGPYYSKRFKISDVGPGTRVSLVIGSIIGVDTMLAKSMGQNRVVSAYASPPEVYFNGNKIADIQVNGDGQRIRIPNNLIKQNQMSEVTIKTGRNMTQTAHVDYDDIEFMNLFVETN